MKNNGKQAKSSSFLVSKGFAENMIKRCAFVSADYCLFCAIYLVNGCLSVTFH